MSQSGVLVLDRSGVILGADPMAASILGATPETLLGKSFFSLPGAEETQGSFTRTTDIHARGWVVPLHGPAEGAVARIQRVASAGEIHAIALVVGPDGDAVSDLARAAEISSHVKHDVNNLLMGLLGHVSLLKVRPDLEDELRKKLVLIEEQGRKIRDKVVELDALRKLGARKP